jgi:hypothetical protein
LGLWLIAAVLSYRSRLWKPGTDASLPGQEWAGPLLRNYLLIIAVCLLGMVLAADVTDFKQRWMLPLTAIAPLALYVWRPALLEQGVGRMFTVFVIVFALVFLIMATLRPWQGGRKNDPDELNHPVKTLAQELRKAGYDGKGVIVGSDHMMAAMLHSQFPQPTPWAARWRTAEAMPVSGRRRYRRRPAADYTRRQARRGLVGRHLHHPGKTALQTLSILSRKCLPAQHLRNTNISGLPHESRSDHRLCRLYRHALRQATA